MPRYFFHVMDDRAFIDYDGVELDSIGDARAEAVRLAGKILALEKTSLSHGRQWRMAVVDTADDLVYSLLFQADHHGY